MAVVAVAMAAGPGHGIALDQHAVGVVGKNTKTVIHAGDGVVDNGVVVPVSFDAGAPVGVGGDARGAASHDAEALDSNPVATGLQIDADVRLRVAEVDEY